MRKKKIVLLTNSPLLRTGLGENSRYIMEYILKNCKDKFELVLYCSQTSIGDSSLQLLPCRAYGCLPTDPNLINQLNADPGKARDASYGSMYVDEVIKKEQPDIFLISDDGWADFDYLEKPYFNKLANIYHITIDSRPVIEKCFKQAEKTPYYFTWTKFAADEMKKYGEKYNHVKHIYAAFDIEDFSPITKEQKHEWRSKFGIDDQTIIFTVMNRNQLRKNFPGCIEAFAKFKKEFPQAKAKLHFHTSFSETQNGWDIMKMAEFNGLAKEDILCTYVCKNCGKWHIVPYQGENVNCPYCGAEKSMTTPTIGLGVPDQEMKFMLGIADAGLSIFDSGGFEKFSGASLLCGLPTAITNYSCGEDFSEKSFITSIPYTKYFQPGTNFVKAASNIDSIKVFMSKVYKMTEKERQKISEQSRNWAKSTFSIDVIGKQWEEVFDSIPFADWSNYSWDTATKNDTYQLPQNYQDLTGLEFINSLYENILKSKGDDLGIQNWLSQLEKGITKEQIYQYFIGVAKTDNDKNKKSDFWSYIDRDRKNKRAIMTIRESIGDCLLITSLLESFHETYPNTDLYIATKEQYFPIFEANPFVHKLLVFQDFMESEMLLTGAGQKPEDAYFNYFFLPAIGTQKILNYLSTDKIAFDLNK